MERAMLAADVYIDAVQIHIKGKDNLGSKIKDEQDVSTGLCKRKFSDLDYLVAARAQCQ